MTSPNELPLPPGKFGLPFIGETIEFFTDRNFQQKRLDEHGDVFKTNIFNKPTVVMVGAEANQCLFRNENKYVKATWPKSTRILLGSSSLATQEGGVHSSRRRILFQAFQPRALESYIPTIEKITQRYLDKWEQKKEFAWYNELRKYTFDVASTLFIGKDGGADTPLANLFEEWVQGLFSLPINLPWTTFGKAMKCRTQLLKELEVIIGDRLANQKSDDQPTDALDLLIRAKDEDGNALSIEELKDQILLLLFAGHETLTSSLVSFCLFVGQNRNVFEKICAEQTALDISGELDMNTLQQMTYLDQVFKEVLRIVPPVGGGFREVIQTFEYKNFQIPKGWAVQYQILQTHKDEENYPDHERFDPERFSPERAAEKQKNYQFIPFGGGMRECIGKEFARLEAKVLGSMLVRGYDWELRPDQDLSMQVIPTPLPKDGLQVRFWRRKKTT
ncbi:(+)-abscisic acid 8'-hydroxylase [[Leptolyngbya] sp. PCC 7376]|uniref:cytochrome P450 n=1 Tax=[Leptolyngbya] sp. PCC 7376 TaxID=111781 RepID=UPI00029F3259|nr:cytochrome P450 [[Leptolyngbya] sp. PCC 7376]AFY40660.1 (+)-abscisic acid 8'-hydroxylase [[Leptolyngbya] sp. PCC 7376]